MEALVWVLAGIVLFDVAIVVVLGLRAEVARRRDRRGPRAGAPVRVAACVLTDDDARQRWCWLPGGVAIGVHGGRAE